MLECLWRRQEVFYSLKDIQKNKNTKLVHDIPVSAQMRMVFKWLRFRIDHRIRNMAGKEYF